jgi:hypothetical protein
LPQRFPAVPSGMVKIQNWVSDAVTVPHEELRCIVAEETASSSTNCRPGRTSGRLGLRNNAEADWHCFDFGIGLAKFNEHGRASEKRCRTQHRFSGSLRCLSIVNHKIRCRPVLLVLPAAQPKALARYMLHWVLQLVPFWPVRFKKMRVI